MKKIVILGAGITGLSAAWYLSQHCQGNFHITLIEKKERIGGYIQSIHKEGFLFERGPRGIRSGRKGKKALSLIHDVGLTDQLISSSDHCKKRYLMNHGKLERVSPSFLLTEGLLWPLFKEPFMPKAKESDETVASFFERRLGRKFTERLIDPLIRGIFGGNIHELSMAAAFPTLFAYERDFGSLIKGFLFSPKEKSGELYSFKEGIQTLPNRLLEKLEKTIDLHLGSFPQKIVIDKNKAKLVFEKEEIEADLIVSTIPSYELTPLLDSTHPFLETIPYATMTTLNVGYEGKKLPLNGFGFLSPTHESKEFLGMTFDSDIFPEQNQGEKTRLCLIFKGNQSEQETLTFAQKIISDLFHINEKPSAYDHHIATNSIPQYALGHVERRKAFSIPSLYVAGSYVDGIGMIDCIDNAERVAREILEKYSA